MSKVRSIRAARKLRTFKRECVTAVTSEDDWEACFSRARDRLIVVEFAAAWSLPCKAMAPYVNALSQQPEFKAVEFLRVDLDACPALGAKHGVLSAPTYQLWRGGNLLDSLQGAAPQRLIDMLAQHKGSTTQNGRLSWKLVGLACLLAAAVAAAVARAGQQEGKLAPTAREGIEAKSDAVSVTSVAARPETRPEDSRHEPGARAAAPQKKQESQA